MGKWILVKNKVPADNVDVLVTTKYGELVIAYYDSEEGWICSLIEKLFARRPIAWQPLPEPFKIKS